MYLYQNKKVKIKWAAGLLMGVILMLFLTACSKTKNKGDEPASPDTAIINYVESQEIFPNPERGFVHNYIVYSEGTGLNSNTLSALRNNNVTMIVRIIYLEKFRDKPLSNAQLTLITQDMATLRNAGMKAVLRFAYTDDMNKPDAPLAIIEQHLDQLKPIFTDNKDVIAFVQAGFIGAWGEWHSSSNGLATPENQRKLLDKLLSVLPVEIMIQVRTPGAKQQVFNSTAPLEAAAAYTADKSARVGHHNVCFLAGGTDYGTYTNITADKAYISKEALYVPTGGETCPPTGEFPSCATAETEMKLLRWTYLNLDWYQPVINAWRSSGCFNIFQRNLGYRLVLEKALLPKKAKSGQQYKIDIAMTNKGYAPLYNYKKTRFVLKNTTTNTLYPIDLAVDLRNCKPNAAFKITETISLTGIPAGTYDAYLQISDKAPALQDRVEYSVRLANNDVWENGLNDLIHRLTVE